MHTAAPFVILIGIAALFWLVMIRPAQTRQRAMAAMQGGISVGDEVMLTSGIFGVVHALDEETVQLQVADGVSLKVVRAAVGRVVAPGPRDVGTVLAAPGADEPEEKQSDGTQ